MRIANAPAMLLPEAMLKEQYHACPRGLSISSPPDCQPAVFS